VPRRCFMLARIPPHQGCFAFDDLHNIPHSGLALDWRGRWERTWSVARHVPLTGNGSEQCLWRHERTYPFTFTSALAAWVAGDHGHDRHSTLNYGTPRQCQRARHTSQVRQFTAV
jgi:hypothetical protein